MGAADDEDAVGVLLYLLLLMLVLLLLSSLFYCFCEAGALVHVVVAATYFLVFVSSLLLCVFPYADAQCRVFVGVLHLLCCSVTFAVVTTVAAAASG